MARNDKYTITEGTLTDIADAIREQLQTEQTYTPQNMPQAILEISGGGGGSFQGVIFDGGGTEYDTSNYNISGVNLHNNGLKYDGFSEIAGGTVDSVSCNNLTIVTNNIASEAVENITISDFIKIEAATIDYNGITNISNGNPETFEGVYLILYADNISSGAISFNPDSSGLYCNVCIVSAPSQIDEFAFNNGDAMVQNVYVSWGVGEVNGAPWGLPNALIHYNTQFDEDGKPII